MSYLETGVQILYNDGGPIFHEDLVIFLPQLCVFVATLSAAENRDLRLVDAARTQDPKGVRQLIDQKADVNVRAGDGSRALLWLAH
jgi:hypothetical protein